MGRGQRAPSKREQRSREMLTGCMPYTLRRRFATTLVLESWEGDEKERIKLEEMDTDDTGGDDIKDDGLVLSKVSDIKLFYEEGLWGLAIGDGRSDCRERLVSGRRNMGQTYKELGRGQQRGMRREEEGE